MKKFNFFLLLLFIAPASTNYKLDAHTFGAGGGIGTSSNYEIQGVAGEVGAAPNQGTSYNLWPGLLFVQMSNTPTAPTFVNDGNYYDKLRITVNTSNNPTDTKYAIAISSDDFTTTDYVQSDNTIGSTLNLEDWQTYTDWGAGSGELIIGLDPNITYKVKVKSIQGDFTESPFGPIASATTLSQTLSFDIDVSSIDEETSAPYSVNLGSLTPNSIITATNFIWIDLTTNANNGANIYVFGNSGGLYSDYTAHTISGVSGNLSGIFEGFGIRSASATQSSGGPLVAESPYDGSGDIVGNIATTPNTVFSTTTAPIISARGSIAIKAKTQSLTPAATDYTETLTFIVAASF